ncbi:hypothetical protein ACFQX8_12380 [Klenkia terrae]|uniref:hypothetical protein n=1 Tax=Klenkia terrae TaxID=1052259 RepID=UPI003616207E
MTAVPTAITQAPLRTIRPQDLAAVYTQPNVQLARLTRGGRVRKAAPGLYYALPDDQDVTWLPTLEAVAAGAATALYGDRVPVLMHLTAARLHGALPAPSASPSSPSPPDGDRCASSTGRTPSSPSWPATSTTWTPP